MANNIFTEFGDNPLTIFQKWYADAESSEPADANAMALATAGAQGRPTVRMVLLKGFNETGFTFFTNSTSRKGRALSENPQAELLFYWKSTEKQIRIAGPVVQTDTAEADAYFATRPRESRIGAWASNQTQPLDDYGAFKTRVAEMEKKFAGQDIPRPDYWNGYRVIPQRMEFWIAHPHRLHKRFVFEKKNNTWEANWLFP